MVFFAVMVSSELLDTDLVEFINMALIDFSSVVVADGVAFEADRELIEVLSKLELAITSNEELADCTEPLDKVVVELVGAEVIELPDTSFSELVDKYREPIIIDLLSVEIMLGVEAVKFSNSNMAFMRRNLVQKSY